MAPAPAASPAPTTPARPTRAPSSSIGGTGGSPGILCTAAASYKKKAGSLTLTKKILSWTPAVEGVDDIEIQNGRLNCASRHLAKCSRTMGADRFERRAALFSSKEGGAKVMIRVGVLPTSAPSAPAPSAAPGTAAPEDFLSFTFTNASSAVSDREQFKREIAQLVSRNRASREEALKGPPLSTGHSKSKENTPGTATPGGEGMDRDKGKSVDPTQDWRVKKRVLQNDPELRQLHKDLVMGKHITEGEFWEGREVRRRPAFCRVSHRVLTVNDRAGLSGPLDCGVHRRDPTTRAVRADGRPSAGNDFDGRHHHLRHAADDPRHLRTVPRRPTRLL